MTVKRPDEKASKIANKTRFLIQIAGGAIFGALSAVVYPVLKPIIDLTRVPEGLALFDPISLIWMACFFIFGPLAGILCSLVGTVTLMPFDSFAPIGPLMKLAATFCLMIVPILLLRLYKQENGSQKLKNPKNFIICAILGVILRDIVMILLNIPVYIGLGYPSEGLQAWLVLIAIVNPIQSIWDLLIPYAIVFGALDYGLKLDEKFEIW